MALSSAFSVQKVRGRPTAIPLVSQKIMCRSLHKVLACQHVAPYLCCPLQNARGVPMIDMAATAHSLSVSHRNQLDNMIIPKNRRSALIGAALVLLGGGWFAFHHMASADATQVAAASPAVP